MTELLATITPAAAPPYPPLPFALPRVALEKSKRDVATQAVLRYLKAAGGVEQAREFDRLVAFCYHAVQPYFLRDRHGSLRAENTPQFDSIKGERTGYNTRNEGKKHDVTREWIQVWLLKFLAPYRHKSEDELISAADNGEFRYLGRLCRLRLKSVVCRQLEREKKERTVYVAICECGKRDIKNNKPRQDWLCECGRSVPYKEEEYACFTGFVSVGLPPGDDGESGDYIGTNRQDAPSSLGNVSFEDALQGVEQARRIVVANLHELDRLDLLSGLLAYLSLAEHVMEPYFKGRVTRAIEALRGVKEDAARSYKRKFHEAMQRELRNGNRLVRSIMNELTHESPRAVIFGEESDEGKDNKRLLREARQLMAEYTNECRVEGLNRSAASAMAKELELLSKEAELEQEQSTD